MATKTIVQYVDDLTGEELSSDKVETVSFSLDNVDYSIDLSAKNAKELRKAMQKYIDSAHKVGRKTGKRGTRTTVSNAKHIREWAKANGFDVPDRGRIPAEVKEAYDKAS